MQKLRKYLVISIIIISISFILFHDRKEYLSKDNILGVYVNNELSDNYPSKDSALFQKAVCDDASTKVAWDNDNWGLLISNLNKKVKCNLYFYSGETVFNFDYTGAEQTFIAPVSGTYKLETWGAQGGDAKNNYYGGYGGYSTGIIFLSNKQNIYINTGGAGYKDDDYNKSTLALGGYNGGGNGCGWNDKLATSGGGATHIAIKSGLLISLEPYKDNILMVSGGGGGSGFQNSKLGGGKGGSGGGYIGNTGSTDKDYNELYINNGATQNSGGNYKKYVDYTFYYSAFGLGGGAMLDNGNSSGGGGGYYGGGGGNLFMGAGGGSGYIGNHLLKDKVMYCYNCEESNEESTKTISTTCSEETPTSNCAKKGNGYARITLVSIDE